MAKSLCQEDATQIAFIREFAEHRGRGATHGESEIDSIAEIHCQCHTIDSKEQSATNLLIYFLCCHLM